MLCLQFPAHQSVSLLETFSKSARKTPVGLSRPHAFADVVYLQRVIAYLESVRKERGIGLELLTRRAGLRKGVISRAEMRGEVPALLEFKAWVRALELPWEEVWSASFPAENGHLS